MSGAKIDQAIAAERERAAQQAAPGAQLLQRLELRLEALERRVDELERNRPTFSG